MHKKMTVFLMGLLSLALSACASSRTLPPWVASPQAPPGEDVAVGFGQGKDEPTAVAEARRHALRQIVDSVFGERIHYRYSKTGTHDSRDDASTVHDFFEAASRGTLVGQRVVHNEIEHLATGYVAYVMVEVREADLKRAYRRFLREEKARRQIYEAEMEGAVLLSEKHYRRALAYYRERLRRDPGNDVWWIGVGASLFRLGRYQEALHATDRALLKNPRSFYGFWNRASILDHLGRWREGVADRAMACRIRPSKACSERLSRDRRRMEGQTP